MKEHVEVFWFSEQPYGYVTDADLAKYPSGRLYFPNTHFDPQKAHVLYNQYHEQYALAVVPALHELTLQPYAA